MTDTDLRQDLIADATSTRSEVSGLLCWPVLGIVSGLLITVAWCGFLIWLVIQV